MRDQILVIAGPTATGKTTAGIAVARQHDAEIISADSRQVYQYLDIGTAKPTQQERAQVTHHMVDFLDPAQPYSAAEYMADARRIMDSLDSQGKKYIVVGGSGLYIRALIEGLAEIPSADEAIRAELAAFVKEHGKEALHQRLQEIDPFTAARLKTNDTVRVSRALEVYQLTGKPISQWHANERIKDHRTYRLVVLDMDREALYDRINQRVDAMLQVGLVDEVRSILAKGYSPTLNALRTVGYQEVIVHLNGEYDLQRMTELIKQNSRNFAKRQLTWFRGMKSAEWVDAAKAERTIFY
jgi:tRNA dimethylallyltransferase